MHTARRLALVAAFILIGSVSAACSSGTASRSGRSRSGELVATEMFRQAVSGEVDHVTLWGHYVAWATGPRFSVNELVVVDRRSGEQHIVARAASPTGLTDWIRGSGEHIVYTDEDHEQTDEQPNTPWRLIVKDLATGETNVVGASTNPVTAQFAPLPMIEEPWVVWGQVTDKGEPVVLTYNLTTRTRHTLFTGDSGWVTIDDGQVVYDAPSSPGRRDVFAVPADGSRTPRQLTHSGEVAYPVAANGRITWQEPQRNDPQSIWVTNLHGASLPTEVVAQQNFGNAVPARSFVGWWRFSDGALTVVAPGHSPLRLSQGSPSVPARFDAAGNEIVWAEYAGGPTDTEHSVVIISRVDDSRRR